MSKTLRNKISTKIALPIILSTIFAITIFIALDYERLTPSFYVVLFFIAIYVFAFGYSTGQKFASPVEELLQRAKKIEAGDFSERIYLDTKDELEELAQIYNKLASEVELACSREKNAVESVDIKVRAKTQSMEETIGALEQKVQNRTIELERANKILDELKNQLRIKEGEVNNLKQGPEKINQK